MALLSSGFSLGFSLNPASILSTVSLRETSNQINIKRNWIQIYFAAEKNCQARSLIAKYNIYQLLLPQQWGTDIAIYLDLYYGLMILNYSLTLEYQAWKAKTSLLHMYTRVGYIFQKASKSRLQETNRQKQTSTKANQVSSYTLHLIQKQQSGC